MHTKPVLIVAFLLLCLPSGGRALDVFQDPSNSGNNPGQPAGVQKDNTQAVLNVWVSDPGTYFGWDVRVDASQGMEFVSFNPDDPIGS